MSRIRSENTKPEKIVRSQLHALGYRYRLQGKVSKKLYPAGRLPGKPDIVLAKHKTVIFVHGCFWHRHKGCRGCTSPKTNAAFWQEKFKKNVENARKFENKLQEMGWNVLVIWECETKEITGLNVILRNRLAVYPLLDAEYLEVAEESKQY